MHLLSMKMDPRAGPGSNKIVDMPYTFQTKNFDITFTKILLSFVHTGVKTCENWDKAQPGSEGQFPTSKR